MNSIFLPCIHILSERFLQFFKIRMYVELLMLFSI